MRKSIKTAICGFFMALADSVPGVSGGTVALLAGEYDSFIGSFGAVIGKDRSARRASLLFLLRLGIGWIVGMGLSVTLLAGFFHTSIYEISSLFLGLVIASIPVIAIEEKEALRNIRLRHLPLFLLGAAVVVCLSFFRIPVSVGSLTFPSALYVFIGGALAISAMVLPGISGSTLLLAFGLYVPILSGVKNFFSLDFSSFPLLFVFGCGVLCGIFCSFKGIHFLLKQYRTGTVFAILGLTVGSLFAVVMGPTTLEEPLPPLAPDTLHIGFLLLGLLIVGGFASLKIFLQRRNRRDGVDHTT